MSHITLLPRSEHLIREAFQDFRLSRRALLRANKTLENYQYTIGGFIEWLDVLDPSEIRTRHVRGYLASVADRGCNDSTLHTHARGVRAFLNFCYLEGYIPQPTKVDMPTIAHRQLPLLNREELKRVVDACKAPRDKALLMLMVDTGLRRAEVCSLNWADIDVASGLVRVRRGKGMRGRSVVIGAKTRRALLKHRRLVPHGETDSVFRLRGAGVRMALLRIGKRAGIHLTAHMLRRTFATLSLRAGINPLHLQALMGHSSLEMTRRYVQLIEDDLLKAHEQHGPIDSWL